MIHHKKFNETTGSPKNKGQKSLKFSFSDKSFPFTQQKPFTFWEAKLNKRLN